MADVKARDGVRLHAEAHGEGLPLVLSCAYSTTHANFLPQVAPLVAAGIRVVLWDYRGHGRSEAPAEPSAYSMDHVVSDLGCVLDWACPGQPAVLGGLSLGGLVSLHYARSHAERVRALVLIDTGPGFKKPEAQAGWEAQVERIAQAMEGRGMRAYVAGRAGAMTVGRHPELPAAHAAADAIAAQDAGALARFGRLVAGPAPSVIDDLRSFSMPTLILVGEEDRPYRRAADVMAARMPAATLEVLPRAGHVCNLEEPEAFDAALVGFLLPLLAEAG